MTARVESDSSKDRLPDGLEVAESETLGSRSTPSEEDAPRVADGGE